MKRFYILAWAAILLLACSLTSGATMSAAVLKTPTERPQTSASPESTQTPTPSPKRCTVTTGAADGRLNMRACAGTGCEVIDILEEGQVLTVLQLGDWLKVQTEANGAGFVNSNYCNVGE